MINTLSKPPKYFLDTSAKLARLHAQLFVNAQPTTDFVLKVRRADLLVDSMRIIMEDATDWDLKQRLRIEFEGEAGKDYGGMSREWFLLVSRLLQQESTGLFHVVDGYQLLLRKDADHRLCRFAGLLMGLALVHEKIVEMPLAGALFKCLLGQSVVSEDLRHADEAQWRSLQWLLENDVSSLEMTFCCGDDPVVEGGEKILITNENKSEYVDRCVRFVLLERCAQQMEAFSEGFHRVIPAALLEDIDGAELECMVCGTKEINVEDWEQQTMYTGGLTADSVVVQKFWTMVRDMSQEERANLLKFVTGTDRLPTGGFAMLQGTTGPQKFTITQMADRYDTMPTAHTCFNRLEFPEYTSEEQLDKMPNLLTLAIQECVGFDME